LSWYKTKTASPNKEGENKTDEEESEEKDLEEEEKREEQVIEDEVNIIGGRSNSQAQNNVIIYLPIRSALQFLF
jgi:hypothetical protein